MTTRVLTGDCREILPTLDAGSIRCCVTSPPYWGLRDYGTGTWEGGDVTCTHKSETSHQNQGATSQRNGRANVEAQRNEVFRHTCEICGAIRVDHQVGLEENPTEYVETLVAVFREVHRVLADDGTLWLNLGDSYANDGKWGDSTSGKHVRVLHGDTSIGRTKKTTGLKPKDLCGIPWAVAFALRDDGWFLRSDIIWSKPNPMPESVTDRPTKAHEYLFLLTKSKKYFYDAEAIKEAASVNKPRPQNSSGDIGKAADESRNKRTVWTVTSEPFKGAHFAVMPTALVVPCILAGSAIGDMVLDPFGGSGTVGATATELGRHATLIELNPEYVKIIERRTAQTGLFG